MDKGHDKLIYDLSELLNEAKNCEFHDFHNHKYEAPKMELVNKLLQLIGKVKEGDYDN